MKFLTLILAATTLNIFAVSTDAEAMGRLRQNTHLIEADTNTGYAIYRVSEPNATDMKNFCKLGITEMMVLSGTGDIDERLAKEYCPTLKVVYNVRTSAKIPLSEEFLEAFDEWVMASKAAGKKIAFRCNCGCHRTGRLAAYYQMKYQGLTAAAANKIMKQKGKFMFLWPQLPHQVRALSNYIHGQPCSESTKYCVRKFEPTAAEVLAAQMLNDGMEEVVTEADLSAEEASVSKDMSVEEAIHEGATL